MQEKKSSSEKPTKFHPKNKHQGQYDFEVLVKAFPELKEFVFVNKYDKTTIDFAEPLAIKLLNKAILKHYYNIDFWDIPNNFLTPPVPGRADYIHHAATLLGTSNYHKAPKGEHIKCLDIGIGANCIYPIIGHQEYSWSFIGSDIDNAAMKNAQNIIKHNSFLKKNVELRLQQNSKKIFDGILKEKELVDLVICNPPFYESEEKAKAATLKKVNNLNKSKPSKFVRNFGGQNNELVCEGGEKRFVLKMVRESKFYKDSCLWFTTLVSQKSNLKFIEQALAKNDVASIEIIPMGQGNKVSRIVAWTYFGKERRKKWSKTRWRGKVLKPT